MGWTQSDPRFRSAPDAASTKPRYALLYASNLNNPLRYLDPDGQAPVGAVATDFYNALASGDWETATAVAYISSAIDHVTPVTNRDNPEETAASSYLPLPGLAGQIANGIYDFLDGKDGPPSLDRGPVPQMAPPGSGAPGAGAPAGGGGGGTPGTPRKGGGGKSDKRAPYLRCEGEECVSGAGGKKKVTTSGEMNRGEDGRPLCDNCAGKARQRGEETTRVNDPDDLDESTNSDSDSDSDPDPKPDPD